MSFLYSQNPYFLYFLLILGIFLYGFSTKFSQKNYVSTLIFGIFLLIARGSAILNNVCLNPDEAQVLAQAITIKVNPVMYESFDGATAGPIHSYFALLPHLLGLPLNYAMLHFLTVLVQIICLWLVIKTLQNLYSLETAVLATLPTVACLLLTTQNSFIHYASEQTPVLVLYLMVWLLTPPHRRGWGGLLLGFLSILIFFCKLQAVPMAFVVVCTGLTPPPAPPHTGRGVSSSTTPPPSMGRGLGGEVFLGAALALALIVALCLYWHVLYEVYLFYFKGNFIHKSIDNQSLTNHIIKYFSSAFGQLADFRMMVWALFGGVVCVFFQKQNRSRWQLGFVLLLFAATVFAIGKSGFVFYHYLNYLFLPLSLFLGWVLGSRFIPKAGVIVFACFLVVLPYLSDIFTKPYPYVYLTSPKPISNVSKAILKYGKAGESLAVWGWGVEYYYETQMYQGTIDNHTIRCFQFSLVEEHRERYMWDMELKRPMIFVDDVTPQSFWMNDPATGGMEKFEDLYHFVLKNYTLAETVEGRRIFVRNDRYKTLNQHRRTRL